MDLTTNVHSSFLELFYSEIKDRELEGTNKLNLFTLKVTNNEFAYNELIEALGNNLHYFALSRADIAELKSKDKMWTIIDKAKSRLRDHLKMSDTSKEGGELGELLLYCLLESHLKAPKILTKLELKTSRQMYVNGADGVHLLKLDKKNYQLIFGEAKLHGDLGAGINSAFGSIATLLDENKKKMSYEVQLVNSQLLKESYDADMYEVLKKIIVPSAQEDEHNMDYSFGIFLGFNIDVDDAEKKLGNAEFRECLRKKIVAKVESSIESIKNQIKKEHYQGYTFYVYVIPFTNIEQTRQDIIKELL